MDRQTVIQTRIKKFQAKMEEAGLNLAVVSRSVNVFYFTDFNPLNFSMASYVLIPAKGEACLLLNSIRGPRSNELSGLRNIKLYGKWSDNPSVAKDAYEAIRIIGRSYQLGELKIGSDLGSLTYTAYLKICEALEVKELTDIGGLIDDEKTIKDELAIDRMRKAAVIGNAGMDKMIAELRAGATEAAAVMEAKYTMQKVWLEKFSEYDVTGFGSPEASIQDMLTATCSSGVRTSYGAESARNIVPAKGDLVLPIIIAKLGGYSIENERSLYVDHLDDYRMKVFETVIEARENVFRAIRPGKTFAELYQEAKTVFERNGFGDFLPGRIGHGIGMTGHEHPSVAPAYKVPLQPGMVFTVEPGLMSAKFGGVRPSDTVLVTETGYELLTDTENGILKM